MTRAPLLLPALAFAGAIAAEAYGAAPIACVLALGALAYPKARTPAAFALGGLLLGMRCGHPPMIELESRTSRFAGTIVGDVRADEIGAAFDLALNGGGVVRAHVFAHDVAPGDRVDVRGRLVPFDEARNPGEPSRRAIAQAEGLAGELHGTVLARAPPDARDARTWAARARDALSRRLRRLVREPEATVIAGALWGERGTLPPAIRGDFQATATVHVLVTAGLHLGVIAALIACALRLARVPRVPAAFATMPCVVAYAWLSGAHLPSQRAAVMACVALLATACGARAICWNALALAAVVVAALWPASVTSVSFALSFSCVAAIGLFASPIAHALDRYAMPERLREPLALTVSTQIGVWPLSAATFGVVAPYAVLANALVVPATALAMAAGVATLALGDVPVLGRLAASLATYDVDLVLRVVSAVASLPGARMWIAPPPAWAIVAYDAIAVAVALVLRRCVCRHGEPDGPCRCFPTLRARRRAAASAIGALACASAAVVLCALPRADGTLTVTMLDVGQGDGIVVRTPAGRVVLIDTGGRLERGATPGGGSPAEWVGERVVVGYLKRHGYRNVDLLLNTHPHGDHVGGFAPVLRALHVDAVADGGQSYGGRAFNDGLHEAATRGVPVHVVRCGDRWSSGDGVVLDVLSPCGALLADGKNDVNENSIVVMLRYGDARMLFMGDAGFETERRLLARGVDVRAGVLKVGHHGSAYASSPEFVAAVRPQVALISDGRHNAFGHPAPSTLAALRATGATVYRTDRCGAIVVRAIGARTVISTMAPCAPPAAREIASRFEQQGRRHSITARLASNRRFRARTRAKQRCPKVRTARTRRTTAPRFRGLLRRGDGRVTCVDRRQSSARAKKC